jgi:hypothetical protein
MVICLFLNWDCYAIRNGYRIYRAIFLKIDRKPDEPAAYNIDIFDAIMPRCLPAPAGQPS